MSCSKSHLGIAVKAEFKSQFCRTQNLRLFLEHHAAFHKFKHHTNHLFIAKHMYESVISISICMFWGRRKDGGVDLQRGTKLVIFEYSFAVSFLKVSPEFRLCVYPSFQIFSVLIEGPFSYCFIIIHFSLIHAFSIFSPLKIIGKVAKVNFK